MTAVEPILGLADGATLEVAPWCALSCGPGSLPARTSPRTVTRSRLRRDGEPPMKLFDEMTRRRALVVFTAFALAAGGALVARRLPSGIYPEVEFPRIVVVAKAGDAPPDVL